MTIWKLVCPHCQTPNEVFKEAVTIKCGVAHFKGTCIKCNKDLEAHQDYWRWLGLPEAPPDENDRDQDT